MWMLWFDVVLAGSGLTLLQPFTIQGLAYPGLLFPLAHEFDAFGVA